MATPHIESRKNSIANIVLMPGDPLRAKYIANKYLKKAKLVNSVRGMTAYTGYYKNKKITVFPSGMGIPSMAIYSYELFNFYNVDTIIRIGTIGAYDPSLSLGDVILANKSISDSTYAKIQSNFKGKSINSTNRLNQLIESTAKETKTNIYKSSVYTTDVFYEKENNYKKIVKKYKVKGVEMECFALFHNAKELNKNATALLTVSDSFCFTKKVSSDERQKKLNKMLELALETCLKL